MVFASGESEDVAAVQILPEIKKRQLMSSKRSTDELETLS